MRSKTELWHRILTYLPLYFPKPSAFIEAPLGGSAFLDGYPSRMISAMSQEAFIKDMAGRGPQGWEEQMLSDIYIPPQLLFACSSTIGRYPCFDWSWKKGAASFASAMR